MIRFLEPWWLLAVLPVLAIAGAYVWRTMHRRAYAVRFTNVDLLKTIAPKGLGYRRHIAAGTFLLMLLALASAMGQPSIDKKQPLQRATIMVAIDVSLSMESTDVAPSRIQAAQQAAKEFVKTLPASYNVGLVSFAKTANVLVSPSKDRDSVIAGINSLQLAEATATGEAVYTCLAAIQSVPPDGASGPPPARIVLLSDGFRTAGRPIEEAATASAAVNVPVSTIAFGTDSGTVSIGGEEQRVPVDRASLQQLAETTRGHYYEAASLSALRQVYQDMGSSIGYKTVPTEITRWYVAAALLFAFAAGGMSLLWSSRLP